MAGNSPTVSINANQAVPPRGFLADRVPEPRRLPGLGATRAGIFSLTAHHPISQHDHDGVASKGEHHNNAAKSSTVKPAS